MPNDTLAKHGTYAGYRTEMMVGGSDNVCERCRNAARVYNTQRSREAKAKGIKYGSHDVIDHLYKPGKGRSRTGGYAARPASTGPGYSSGRATVPPPGMDAAGPGDGPDPAQSPTESRTIFDQLTDGLKVYVTGGRDDYVESDEPPDYIQASDADPEPGGDWSTPTNDEYVITAKDIAAIKDNLGTYLATAGMTLGLIDSYCGSVLRDNLDDMVDGWTRVIAHYPTAAKMFMAKGGGKIMAWIDALMATWPILLAIYEHHFSKAVDLDSNGRPFRVTKTQSPNGKFATEPQFDYTVN